MNGTLKNTLLSLGSLFGTLIFAVAADWLVGVFFPAPDHEAKLILPAYSRRQHTTSEFHSVITTNNFGFRDRDFFDKPPDTFRVLAIGDSFTYGWGVQNEEAWPKVLESLLREDGYKIEIANLGRPGAYPKQYTELAARAIPLLKPDLVLLAVLQGDDLVQSKQRSDPISDQVLTPAQHNAKASVKGDSSLWTGLTRSLFPNLSRRADIVRLQWHITDINELMVKKRDSFLSTATPEELEALNSRDSRVLDAFHHGNLNPALIDFAIRSPHYLLDASNAEHPDRAKLIENIIWEFQQTKSIADRYGAKVHVVSVPLGVFVSKRSYDSRERLGFVLDTDMLVGEAGDTPIRKAAQSAGVPFNSATEAFRSLCIGEALFFELDGHLNVTGQRRYAESLKPVLQTYLN